ncbi:hypothetical protein [Polyangium sp. 6x1]|uniref:hypothetical protein n=1 Tax=Polyangium sp. 6x1 TaxID=3042689 RepID=UPI002482F627|nr:hypothetical protein [Polyangium sp. 6x1]MDI1443657.1 hypothetical protein [Polyangium sp. 6x1]
MLDPTIGTATFIVETLPAFLRSVLPTTQRDITERHGGARGRVDWARTFAAQSRTQDTTTFVCTAPRRTFERAELILMRWLVARVLGAIDDLHPASLPAGKGWTSLLPEMHRVASSAASHAALRDLPVRAPAPQERASAVANPLDAVKQAVRVLAGHDELLPQPSLRALAASMHEFALVPVSDDRRFEIFVLLALAERIDALFPGATRKDALIEADREHVFEWSRGDEVLHLYFDQSAGSGHHDDVMAHYFGQRTAIRPDIRLSHRRHTTHRTLYLDAKNSEEFSYLAASHLKMHGYIAHKPHVFADRGARVVIVCPGRVMGHVRDIDPVVFVGAKGCMEEAGGLEQVLRTFLS